MEDESIEFWQGKSARDLAEVAAEMHRQRRVWNAEALELEVQTARRVVGEFFTRGTGVEVGAGSRPFPISSAAVCRYGDIRDEAALRTYFHGAETPASGSIDAQTFEGWADSSLDFVISAHVLEHLEDPITAIRHAIRVLSKGGIFILVVPDRRYTFDKSRPPTALQHVIADAVDGGLSTRHMAYCEHLRFLHPQWMPAIPDEDIDREARIMAERRADTHFHVWDTQELRAMLDYIATASPLDIVGSTFVVNENIFVLRRKD